jgi:hypothetical protein
MAILSTGSAECIAVSSLIAYDVYRTYCNPNATGKEILMFSRVMVFVWAIVMALASIVLKAMGINLGWVYCFMGIWIGSAVPPVAGCIYTDKLGGMWAILAAWGGLVAALISWVAMAASIGGTVDKDTLGMLDAQLVGGLVALCASFLICALGCCIAPQNYNWQLLIDGIKLVGGDGGENAKVLGEDWESKPEFLAEARAWVGSWAWGLSIFMCVFWPLACVPMGVFGKSTFQLWAAVAFLWGYTMAIVVVCLPPYESLSSLMEFSSALKKPKGGEPKAGGEVAVA